MKGSQKCCFLVLDFLFFNIHNAICVFLQYQCHFSDNGSLQQADAYFLIEWLNVAVTFSVKFDILHILAYVPLSPPSSLSGL